MGESCWNCSIWMRWGAVMSCFWLFFYERMIGCLIMCSVFSRSHYGAFRHKIIIALFLKISRKTLVFFEVLETVWNSSEPITFAHFLLIELDLPGTNSRIRFLIIKKTMRFSKIEISTSYMLCFLFPYCLISVSPHKKTSWDSRTFE